MIEWNDRMIKIPTLTSYELCLIAKPSMLFNSQYPYVVFQENLFGSLTLHSLAHIWMWRSHGHQYCGRGLAGSAYSYLSERPPTTGKVWHRVRFQNWCFYWLLCKLRYLWWQYIYQPHKRALEKARVNPSGTCLGRFLDLI